MDFEEKRRKRLASEEGETWNPVRGGIKVALIYPNTYSVGMSNLGFQTIYHLLNQRDDTTCERVFLPDREEREKAGRREGPCRSLETGSPLNTFDLLAFSVSFEMDYPGIVEILQGSKIPPLRQNRIYGKDPMVWIGGVGVSINPEPLADLADLIFVGEADDLVPEVMDRLVESSIRDRKGFDGFCEKVRELDGIYFPHAYDFQFDTLGCVTGIANDPGFPQKIKRRWIRDLDRFPTVSRILTPDTELNDMFLVELDRGCGRHCRFCAAGYLYRPPRFRRIDGVLASVREGLVYTDRIGLVGTAVSDYPHLTELVQKIRSQGAGISISSLRADAVSADLMDALFESGHKTVTLAPEGGSERIRKVINKGIKEEGILDACSMALSSGIMNLKLYFLVGLPLEEDEDIEALIALVLKIKEIQLQKGKKPGKIGRITVSLNCFVPKPHTPFQWASMNKKSALSKKLGYIKKRLQREGNITVLHDLPKWAIIQGLISRGDRRLGSLFCSVVEKGGNWAQVLKEWGREWSDAPFRERMKEELFPWEVVETGCRREYLHKEYARAGSGRSTPDCPEDLRCDRCGVCHKL